jgi:hypothetical protein
LLNSEPNPASRSFGTAGRVEKCDPGMMSKVGASGNLTYIFAKIFEFPWNMQLTQRAKQVDRRPTWLESYTSGTSKKGCVDHVDPFI